MRRALSRARRGAAALRRRGPHWLSPRCGCDGLYVHRRQAPEGSKPFSVARLGSSHDIPKQVQNHHSRGRRDVSSSAHRRQGKLLESLWQEQLHARKARRDEELKTCQGRRNEGSQHLSGHVVDTTSSGSLRPGERAAEAVTPEKLWADFESCLALPTSNRQRLLYLRQMVQEMEYHLGWDNVPMHVYEQTLAACCEAGRHNLARLLLSHMYKRAERLEEEEEEEDGGSLPASESPYRLQEKHYTQVLSSATANGDFDEALEIIFLLQDDKNLPLRLSHVGSVLHACCNAGQFLAARNLLQVLLSEASQEGERDCDGWRHLFDSMLEASIAARELDVSAALFADMQAARVSVSLVQAEAFVRAYCGEGMAADGAARNLHETLPLFAQLWQQRQGARSMLGLEQTEADKAVGAMWEKVLLHTLRLDLAQPEGRGASTLGLFDDLCVAAPGVLSHAPSLEIALRALEASEDDGRPSRDRAVALVQALHAAYKPHQHAEHQRRVQAYAEQRKIHRTRGRHGNGRRGQSAAQTKTKAGAETDTEPPPEPYEWLELQELCLERWSPHCFNAVRSAMKREGRAHALRSGQGSVFERALERMVTSYDPALLDPLGTRGSPIHTMARPASPRPPEAYMKAEGWGRVLLLSKYLLRKQGIHEKRMSPQSFAIALEACSHQGDYVWAEALCVEMEKQGLSWALSARLNRVKVHAVAGRLERALQLVDDVKQHVLDAREATQGGRGARGGEPSSPVRQAYVSCLERAFSSESCQGALSILRRMRAEGLRPCEALCYGPALAACRLRLEAVAEAEAQEVEAVEAELLQMMREDGVDQRLTAPLSPHHGEGKQEGDEGQGGGEREGEGEGESQGEGKRERKGGGEEATPL